MEYRIINLIETRELNCELTKSEESILDFIEKNFQKIPEYSVIALSKATYSSQASINRLCKKLGMKGFSHLKFAIKEDLELMKSSTHNHINSLSYYIKNIDFESLLPIIKVFRENKRLLIYGLGASQITAAYLQRQLLYLGYQAILLSEEKMLEHFDGFPLLILSSSGETPRIKQAAKKFRDRGNTLISITRKESTLEENSTLAFTHTVSVDKLDVIAREQQMHMFIMVNEIINKLSRLEESGK